MGKQNSILVFGGAGFVGSHLCEELVKNNQVICVDNFKTSSMENIRYLLQNPNFIFIKHDINDLLDLNTQPELKRFNVETQGIQEVYNLACPTSAKNFDEFVIDTVLSNSQGVKNILDLVLKYDAKFLHLSSAVVYGARSKNNVKEEDNGQVDFLSPRACYDEGKRFAETLITTYSNFHKKNFKIARLF
ncbi:NAD-dependent epimerase/dehydratase family protein, partial [bacterium]|nr:NAD-dependent epimerase/dehydratase family protein [bacterium]